jgi:hypothetical protein
LFQELLLELSFHECTFGLLDKGSASLKTIELDPSQAIIPMLKATASTVGMFAKVLVFFFILMILGITAIYWGIGAFIVATWITYFNAAIIVISFVIAIAAHMLIRRNRTHQKV